MKKLIQCIIATLIFDWNWTWLKFIISSLCEIEMEIPGFKKEEINLSYEKEVLSIWAERKPAEPSDERSYLLSERAHKVKRSFVVKGIDEEKITAKYENGLLTIILPLKDKLESAKRVYID